MLPLGEDSPSPEQLAKLVARSVMLAKQEKKFHDMPDSVSARSHSMMSAARVIIPDIFEAPFGYRYEHRTSARVSRPGPRKWSMRLLSTFMVTDMGSQRGVERHTYRFAWNTQEATLAQHELRIIPTVEYEDICDEIEHFHADDTIADEFYWRTQLREVTRGDVDLLTRELTTLYEQGNH